MLVLASSGLIKEEDSKEGMVGALFGSTPLQGLGLWALEVCDFRNGSTTTRRVEAREMLTSTSSTLLEEED
jgi:hypothetical protein